MHAYKHASIRSCIHPFHYVHCHPFVHASIHSCMHACTHTCKYSYIGTKVHAYERACTHRIYYLPYHIIRRTYMHAHLLLVHLHAHIPYRRTHADIQTRHRRSNMYAIKHTCIHPSMHTGAHTHDWSSCTRAIARANMLVTVLTLA